VTKWGSTFLGRLMTPVIIEIPDLWHEIADNGPDSLNGRSVNKNSFATGILGELAVSQVLNGLNIPHTVENTYDYDFLAENIKIDVKSSNSRFPRVGGNNSAMLTDYLRNQKCDAYVFASVCLTDNLVYVMGCCAKFWFWKTDCGQDYKAGEKISVRRIKEAARILKYRYLTSIYRLPLLLKALK